MNAFDSKNECSYLDFIQILFFILVKLSKGVCLHSFSLNIDVKK
jgi:hypothetical protein